MEDTVLQEILKEMKGFRSDLTTTNSKLSNLETKIDESNRRLASLEDRADESNRRLASLEDRADESNRRLASLEDRADESNRRLASLEERTDGTNKRLDGLNASFIITQQAYSEMKADLNDIKRFLSERVIWNNDSISIETDTGSHIHGTIHKGGQK
jgi:chromosome segregation ATPase